MNVRDKLRKENIAEYILYMWQMEDIIRANKCDIDEIRKNIIHLFNENDREEETLWFGELCDMMHTEGITEKGHLQILKNLIADITSFHTALLSSSERPQYCAAYYTALPFIVELRAKSGGNEVPEIETCLTALYGELILRLQDKEMSDATKQGLNAIRKFIAILASCYSDECNGNLKLEGRD